MLVVFEGIDGSGKTTLSNRVARALAAGGLSVKHVRQDGLLASPTAEAVRLFARDPRQAALSPMAELMLYAARDAQQLDEVMRPALATHDVVIADRFVYTAWVMATAGRGLPDEVARPVAFGAARGLLPELVILVDVDPTLARGRRRAGRLLEPEVRPPSRKGLSGEGLMHRLVAGYRALAAAEPARWIVVDNSDAELDQQVAEVTRAILAARARPEAPAQAAREVLAPPAQVSAARPARPAPATPEAARAALVAWIDRRVRHEPALAAWMLGGLHGPDVDDRREALAAPVPAVIAAGLGSLDDEASWRLRERLADTCPGAIVRGLTWAAALSPRTPPLRARLATTAPLELLASLDGDDRADAWHWRDTLGPDFPATALASLAGLAGATAWRRRRDLLEALGGDAAFAGPLGARAAVHATGGLADDEAWDWRRRALAAAPSATLASLYGQTDARAWALREAWIARAPRPILRGLELMDDDRAHDLRALTWAQAPEAIASLAGLDSARAWALREAAAPRWPAAVARSLAGAPAASPRGQALLARLFAEHPGHIGLWKQATLAVSAAPLPIWAATAGA